MLRSILGVVALCIFISTIAGAATFIVPDDYAVIQDAIDASSDHDTVLVRPGEYIGNINFNGHNIVLGSRYLTTGNTSYISSTAIFGDSSDIAVVTFESGEDTTASLVGFTISYGSTNYGGAIYCSLSSPGIISNIMTGNYSFFNFSGTIYCTNSSPLIYGNLITENYGGGIYCESDCSPTIINNIIKDNEYGGGIRATQGLIEGNLITGNIGSGGISCGETTIRNNTITNNVGGGISGDFFHGRATLINNIVWNNDYAAGEELYGDFQSINYCDIKGGWPGEGNIDCDPSFCNLALNDFHLAANSCCIGAGEGGTDIGAFGVGCGSQYPELMNVPEDFATIQEAIDAGSHGDTILVQPGVYHETVNFYGKNIMLGSLYMVTGDTSYITSTIIDPNNMGRGVTFANMESDSASITGFTIRNGFSFDGDGGGIFCDNSNPIIDHNIISSCTARGEHGGGIGIANGANPVISNNTINNNYALWAGGGISCINSYGTLNNNRICNNASVFYGGGIYTWNSRPTISNNIISGNSVEEGDGGGIQAEYNLDTDIIGNRICDNTASRWGGGIHCEYTNSNISGNLIYNNFAGGDGGGFCCRNSSTPTFSSNTITGNTAQENGGGMYVETSNPVSANCIYWNNSAIQEGSEIYIAGESATISYCDIQDTVWPGDGNISCDPLFCDVDAENYHLNLTSCCIHTGESGANIGAMRIGCQEEIYYVPGDVSMANGTWPPAVIGSDVTYLVNYFKINPANPSCLINGLFCAADVNGDCQVIGGDVTKLVSYFRGLATLEYCPDFPPAWETPAACPLEPPVGWPGCE